ncbi:CMRF35-like molecule 1 isoform X1 [Esox lucius]|uniref:Ig-like domain-containing protein n=1 Tax=Esox lucius TaxID=8010 RepID=A0A6Q2XTN7_ESOLU|nr:CMRF35-like molecule 1 isoform X1 [Esox lucius]
MNILHVVSCCLLSGPCLVSAVTKVTGVVGGKVIIKCSLTGAENIKYFCKRTCYVKDVLIQTKDRGTYIDKGRYSLHDFRNGDFTVTIKDLKKSDSGTYWCGAERYGPDSYQEVKLRVTDAFPNFPTTYSNFSTTLPNHSGTSSNISTSLPNLSGTSPNLSSAPGYSIGVSSTEGLTMWTSVGLVVMMMVLGLSLLLFHRERRIRKSTHPVSSNTNTAPSGEAECVYDEIREADRQTVVSSSIYTIVNSDTIYPAVRTSATYPANSATGDQCDLHANASCSKDDIDPCYSTVDFLKDHIDPIYSTADPPDALMYSSLDLPKVSRISSVSSTASRTQDGSIYSTAQLPKDPVEHMRWPDVQIYEDTPKDAVYSTAQLPEKP